MTAEELIAELDGIAREVDECDLGLPESGEAMARMLSAVSRYREGMVSKPYAAELGRQIDALEEENEQLRAAITEAMDSARMHGHHVPRELDGPAPWYEILARAVEIS